MKKILDFLNTYGTLVLIILGLTVILNTCGTKGNIERTGRRIDKLEKTVKSLDSTLSTKISKDDFNKELDIYNLKTEKSVLYNMNEIVLKNVRPSQRINEIDLEISKLEKELKK